MPAPYGGAGEEAPPELEGVDIEEKLEASLPTQLLFTNDRGQKVRLGDLVGPTKPAILTFNYSNCPLLCSVQLAGLTETLSKIERTPGNDFRIITVSLDPKETAARARETKLGYLANLNKAREARGLPGADRADDGWTFLTGDEASIKALTETVGFGYVYHPRRKEYLHPATFMTLTPDARVAQYVYGVHFERGELDAALTSAGLGLTTEASQDFILSCYHYEAPEGANGFRIMRIGAGFFAALVVLALGGLHLRSRLSKRPVGTA